MSIETSDVLLARFLAGETLPEGTVETNEAWREEPDYWRCPGCLRTKWQIPWVSRRGRVTAKLVTHHDHVEHDYDEPWNEVSPSDRGILRFICDHATVFEPTLTCEACNHIDVRTRNTIPLPTNLSWAPAEIRTFIVATPHRLHEIKPAALKVAWERRARAERRRRDFIAWSIKVLREGTHWRQLGVANLDDLRVAG